MNIRVSEEMLDQVKMRAAEHNQSIQDYVTSLISRDIDAERLAIRQHIKEVLERDGAWLEEWESR